MEHRNPAQDPAQYNRRNAAEFIYDMWKREAMESSRPHAKRMIHAGFTLADLNELEKDDQGVPCSLCQALREELTHYQRLYQAAQSLVDNDTRQLRLPFPEPQTFFGEDLFD